MNHPATKAFDRSPLLAPFYPALDGLRAIAILLVFMVHFCSYIWPWQFLRWGWVGVDLFFVLSGFLITGILYDSLHRIDYFRNFYIRRALRIFPLYYAFWVLAVLITPVIHIEWNRYCASMIAYIGNFFIASGRLAHHADAGMLMYRTARHPGEYRLIDVSYFWSLCIEEQFYLIWPALIWFVRSRNKLLAICIAVIAIVPVGRTLYLHFHPEALMAGSLYFPTPARIDTLLFGSAIALYLRGPSAPVVTVRRVAYLITLAPPLLLAVLLFFGKSHPTNTLQNPIVVTIGYSLVALTSSGLLLFAIDPACRFVPILKSAPLVAIGRISYGLYILHGLVNQIFTAEFSIFAKHHMTWIIPPLGFIITYALAWLSFRFLESPFLRLKERFAPRPGAIADPPSA